MGQAKRVVGIDLDNTIINYDRSCHVLAVAQGWLPQDAPRGKRAVRDALRAQPDGEMRWRQLQAQIYGPRLDLAEPMPGVMDFFLACRGAGLETCVVSHKTRFANAFDTGVDLCRAAMHWLDGHGFFDARGGGLSPGDIWFEPDRGAKARRIAALHCALFIDDLEEVFSDPAFPPGVEKILFAPSGPDLRTLPADLAVHATWQEIAAHVLRA